MEWEFIAQLVVAATAVATVLVVAFGRADWLLWLCLFGFGFGGFNVYVAQTVWFPSKEVMLGVVTLVVLRLPQAWRSAGPHLRVQLILILAWVTVTLGMSTLIEAPLAKEYETGLQGSILRPIVQALNYLQYAGLVFLPIVALKRRTDIVTFWSVYLLLAMILVIGAMVQMSLAVLGLPFMPILRAHGEHSLVAAFERDGAIILRAYSFSGEPKSLALFLVPLLLAMVMVGPLGPWTWLRSRALLFGVAVATVLTFSSSGLIGAGLGMLGCLIFLSSGRTHLIKGILSLATIGCAVGVVSMLVGADAVELLRARTVERVGAEFYERREVAVLEYLLNDPILLFTGVGPGMIVFHVIGFHYGEGIAPLESG